MSDLQQRVRDIFILCRRAANGNEVEAILDRECGSESPLRQAVSELLDAAIEKESFLEQPSHAQFATPRGVSEPTCDVSVLEAQEGGRIHGYKLLQQIGEGGFGTVFMAQQTEPIRRKVALKVIKLGMDSKEVIARFEAERQALAMMDHPHVAKVLDAGTTENGRPFFVMELVQGTKISEFCDDQCLTTNQRLVLFVDVCRAVQHAHMKGIIHRDLKPSNILVAMDGDRPVPKVIDFGVSKAITQSLTDQTMFTRYGQMIGTPLYMSPEQAQFSVHDVDVRSDVYSLGVVLYELLIGTTPFERDDLMRSGFEEMQRMIREVEPLRPSARVKTLHAGMASTVSENRRIDLKRFSSSLAGELDWIVMKALEKERSRRYESARELAADIQRHLDCEAVEARPPSVQYRFGKFARRHRVALTTSALIVASLITGLSIAIWQAAVASQERDRAAHEARISTAVNSFLHDDLLAQASPEHQPNPNVKLRTVIDQAAERLETRFEGQPLVEAAIRHTLAKTYLSLGDYGDAARQISRTVSIRRRELGSTAWSTIDSMQVEATVAQKLGNYRQAEAKIRHVLSIAQRPLVDDKVRTSVELAAAGILRTNGHFAEAETLAFAAVNRVRECDSASTEVRVQALTEYARVKNDAGDFHDSRKYLNTVLSSVLKEFRQDHPFVLEVRYLLVIQLMNEGRYREAQQSCKRLLRDRLESLGPKHPDVLRAKYTLSATLLFRNQFAEALRLAEEGVLDAEKILGGEHLTTLKFLDVIASCQKGLHNFEKAQETQGKILATVQSTHGKTHPLYIQVLNNAATVSEIGGSPEESIRLLSEARDLGERYLGKEHPLVLITIRNLAGKSQDIGEFKDARRDLEHVFRSQHRMLGESHPETLATLGKLGSLAMAQGDVSEAGRHFRNLEALATQRYGNGDLQYALLLRPVIRYLNLIDELKDAEAKCRVAMSILEKEVGLQDIRYLQTRGLLGEILIWRGKIEESREHCQAVYDEVSKQSGDKDTLSLLAAVGLGKVLGYAGDFQPAFDLLESSASTLTSHYGEDSPLTLQAQRTLAFAYFQGERYESSRDLLESISPKSNSFQRDWILKLLTVIYHKIDEPERMIAAARQRFNFNREQHLLSHESVLDAANDLTIYLQKAGQDDQVLEFCEEWIAQFEGITDADNQFVLWMRQRWATVLVGRAEQLTLAEKFDEALRGLTEIINLSPDKRQSEALVSLMLYLDDHDGSSKFSAYLFEQAQQASDKGVGKARWLVDSLLSPDSQVDANEAIALIKPIAEEKRFFYTRLALGMAYYRAGQFDMASSTILPDDGGAVWIRPISSFFLAMAYSKSGDTESAKKSFEEAVMRMNAIAATPTTGVEVKETEPPRWALWCLYQGLRREAAEVVGVEIATPTYLPPLEEPITVE